MTKAFRMLLLLALLGATACRQAVKVVVHAQSGAALTQSSFRSADVVPPKKTDAVTRVRRTVLRRERPAARFAMTITVTPPCSEQSALVAPVTRRS